MEQEKAEAALAQKQVQELRRELEAERRKAAKADELAELYRSGRDQAIDELRAIRPQRGHGLGAESLAAQVVQFAAQRSGLCQRFHLGAAEVLERLGQPGKHHIEARIERQGNDGVGQKAHVGAVVEPVIVKERVADKKQSKGSWCHLVTESSLNKTGRQAAPVLGLGCASLPSSDALGALQKSAVTLLSLSSMTLNASKRLGPDVERGGWSMCSKNRSSWARRSALSPWC